MNWIENFVTLAGQTVTQLRRKSELHEWLAQLEPSCNTCTKGERRYSCYNGTRRICDTSPCATFEEIPDVAREREIAVAAFECQTEDVH